MIATKLSCPSCGTLLKLPTSLAAGKQIKCPKCDLTFAVPGDDATLTVDATHEPTLTGGKTTIVTGTRQPPSSIKQNGTRAAEGDPATMVDGSEGEVFAIVEDEKKSSVLLWSAVGGGAFALLLVGGLVAWLCLRDKTEPSTPAPVAAAGFRPDGLKHLPTHWNASVGFDAAGLQANYELKKLFKAFTGLDPKEDRITIETEVKLDEIDHLVFAEKRTDHGKVEVLVVKTKKPYDKKKVHDGWTSEKFQDKTEYYTSKTGSGRSLYLPNDQVLVFFTAPSEDLGEVLSVDPNKAQVGPEPAYLLDKMGTPHFWAIDFGSQTETNRIEKYLEFENLRTLFANSNVQKLIEQLDLNRAVAIWGKQNEQEVQLAAAFHFADKDGAGRLKDLADKVWSSDAKEQLDVLLRDDGTLFTALNVKVTQENELALVSSQIPLKALESASKDYVAARKRVPLPPTQVAINNPPPNPKPPDPKPPVDNNPKPPNPKPPDPKPPVDNNPKPPNPKPPDPKPPVDTNPKPPDPKPPDPKPPEPKPPDPKPVNPQEDPSLINLKKIGAAYYMYLTQYRRPPQSAVDLKTYIGLYKQAPLMLQQGLSNPDEYLVSPNDKQPYVVVWNINPTEHPDTVFAFEHVGKDGKRATVQTTGKLEYLTEDQFKKAKFPKGFKPPAK